MQELGRMIKKLCSKLFVFNEIMALLPYLYLMFTWIII